MLSLRLLDTVVASLFLKIVSAALLVETKSNPTAEMLQPAHLTLNDESLEWVLPEILSANLSHDPRLTNCVWPYSRNGVCKAAALCELQGAAYELTFEVRSPSLVHHHQYGYLEQTSGSLNEISLALGLGSRVNFRKVLWFIFIHKEFQLFKWH
jgi:hypothetical protein